MQTATNKQPGEQVAFVNNQWLPVDKTATNKQTGARAYLVGGSWQTDEQAQPKSGMELLEEIDPSAPKTPKPSLWEKNKGVAETALSLATGATTGAVGAVGGFLGSLAGEIATGEYGTQEGVERAAESTGDAAAKLTYAPRTKTGQKYTSKVGDFMGEYVAPIAPLSEVATVAQMAKPAIRTTAPTIKDTVKNAAQSVGKYVFSDTEPVGSVQSVGASATTGPAQRAATASSLPKPIKLTLGEATRQADQLAFEKEQLRGALGGPLRERVEENNLSALQNFEVLIDSTDARAPDLSTAGNAVTRSMSLGWKKARDKTRAAYKAANTSPEAIADVDPTPVLEYLNSRPTGLKSTAMVDTAKKYAEILDIAKKDKNGNLVSAGPNIQKMEQLYKEINAATGFEPTDIREATIIKKLINQQTDPVAGPLYQKAKKLRTTQGWKYENRAVVARLLNKVRGSDDPKVAASEVFKKSILDSTPEEITFLKRVIQTSDKNKGPQAWKELQGAAIKHIRDEATKGMQRDSMGNEMISPAKLHQVINQFDKNNRLNIIFGNKTANTLRDLDEVIGYVNTVPPGTLINNSGTASALIGALAEAGVTGSITGLPVPVISVLRALSKHMTNQKMKAKIDLALQGVK